MLEDRLLRLFLAGPLPAALQADVFAALGAARRAASQARWVRPGQLHVTLAFFAKADPSDVSSLVAALRPLGLRHRGLSLDVRGAGCFGRPHQPELLYAKLSGDLGGLLALHADVEASVAPLRQTPVGERSQPFHPHLTLARARGRHGDAALLRCQRALREQPLGAFLLEHLVLFQSELKPTGPEHTALAEFPLGRADSAHP